jgi:hypothetical protein
MKLYEGSARLIVHGVERSRCDLIILEQPGGRGFLAIVKHYDNKKQLRGTETFALARLQLKRQQRKIGGERRTLIEFFVAPLYAARTYSLQSESGRLYKALKALSQ